MAEGFPGEHSIIEFKNSIIARMSKRNHVTQNINKDKNYG